MGLMEVRRTMIGAITGMASGSKFPHFVKIFGPVECISKQLVFTFDAARQGFFIVLPDHVVTVADAVEHNQMIVYGLHNPNMYQSYYASETPVDNVQYTYRDFVIKPDGTYDSWANASKYMFNENTLTVSDGNLINGWKYYLLTIQTFEGLSQESEA